MKSPRLRSILDVVGLIILAGGLLVFALAVAFTVYAFVEPDTLYGAHVPILGLGFLVLGVVGGGALRLLANIDRRVERLEVSASANSSNGSGV